MTVKVRRRRVGIKRRYDLLEDSSDHGRIEHMAENKKEYKKATVSQL